MNKISRIDELIKNQYSNREYKELKALANLFSYNFIYNLERILNENCINNDSFSDKYKIQEGWIDKIPMAEFLNVEYDINKNQIHGRVEIGDFLIVFHHYFKNKRTNQQDVSSRAVIVQAKIANMAYPKVPIVKIAKNKFSSTSKELKLLSDWPIFNLYKTSKSNEAVQKSLKIIPSYNKAKFAGYYNKTWYIGNPKALEICSVTLGSLIDDIIRGNEGASFQNNNFQTDWDKLINSIIAICKEYALPPSLFSRRGKRLLRSSLLYSYALLFLFPLFQFRPRFRVLIINRYTEE